MAEPVTAWCSLGVVIYRYDESCGVGRLWAVAGGHAGRKKIPLLNFKRKRWNKNCAVASNKMFDKDYRDIMLGAAS